MSQQEIEKEVQARLDITVNAAIKQVFDEITENIDDCLLKRHELSLHKHWSAKSLLARGTLRIQCQGYEFYQIGMFTKACSDLDIYLGAFQIEFIDNIQYIKINIEAPTDIKRSYDDLFNDTEGEVLEEIVMHNAE